ncbi:MAG: permease [Bacilli bacterium]|nr:permease [Bacilli bacterium]
MIKNISIIFMSIFLESLPFLFLGAFISAIIETYISNETIVKLIPKNKILGSIFGIFLGFFIPACDCAVIPISKRLIKKKVPINVAISFMLASPIINPVVLLSTYSAFYKNNSELFWYRLLFGIVIALVIGIIMGILFNNKKVLNEENECPVHYGNNKLIKSSTCTCEKVVKTKHSFKNDSLSIIKYTIYDLIDVVKYLMIGGLIASLVQVLLPRSILLLFNDYQVLAIVVLMLFAYLISLCSTSDSFVGKSLLVSFGNSSVLAYLLLGPMIDIKNTFVLLGNYKKNFVISLISLIFIVIFICSVMVVILV